MKQYKVHIIDSNMKTHILEPVWASNPYNALNIAATLRYGAKGFEIVKDETVMGRHANNLDKTESMEIH